LNDKFCELVLESILDKKALNTIVLDISEVSLMADFMIVCTGTSKTHIQGIANFILEKSKENGHKIYNIDGMSSGEWVLIDLGTVIVHIMLESIRNFYTLEKLWNNGKIVYLNENYTVESKKA
jgi:ribosome-associated protein